MKNRLLLGISIVFALLIQSLNAAAQKKWQPISSLPNPNETGILSQINRYQAYHLNKAELLAMLSTVGKTYQNAVVIDLPNPDGSLEAFKVWETPIMETPLALAYPELKQYTAEQVGNAHVTAKIDISPIGFRAMIFNGAATFFVEPIADAQGIYISFYKKDRNSGRLFSCSVDTSASLNEQAPPLSEGSGERLFGATRRTYRLAMAATGEYTAFHGGTVASALAAITTSMNRVNGVYERELAVTMTLIANNNLIIYTNGLTDPYTNNNGSTMLGENQTNLTAVIGLANFDIGHVFSTGGGGVATLGSVCASNTKARGVTGLGSPVGDVFDIDFVCHEIGHQFNANHTFNGTTSSCGGGNRSASSAYEPGSGTTIMAYAGICGAENVQMNSDAYFHAVSLRSISNFVTTGNGASCAAATTSTNTPNVFPSISDTFRIPNRTPFELLAPIATDTTLTGAITYCWEEFDLGSASPPNTDAAAIRPIFRSFNPDTTRLRVFPRMSNILSGTTVLGESLPFINRTMRFVLTTRDFYQGWGCFNSTFDENDVNLVVHNISPSVFDVTSQATSTTWQPGSTQTVTWTTGGTESLPVNCPNVNIYLSVDGAGSFPYLLASNVPNNGSATVTVPINAPLVSNARVKVKGADNVFFQINKANLTIAGTPLPVVLLSWDVATNGCGAKLTWNVAEVKNADEVIVERSANGRDFEIVYTVQLVANGLAHYADEVTNSGQYFYRLKFVDADGKYEYSPTKQVSLTCASNTQIVVAPNPTNGLLKITGLQNVREIQLYTIEGAIVFNRKTEGLTETSLDLSGQASGVYILKCINSLGEVFVQKIDKK